METFQGINPKAVDFLIGLALNNEKAYFLQHKQEFEEYLQQPMYALAAELGPTMHKIDADLELRPQRVCCKIYRDVRYSHGILYRDHLWLSWKHPGIMNSEAFTYYFSFSPRGASYGLGFYSQVRPMMEAYRDRIETMPSKFRELISSDAFRSFTVDGERYKKMPRKVEVEDDLKDWYLFKHFYLEKNIPDLTLTYTPDLVDLLKREFLSLKPFYDFMYGRL